MAILNQGSRRAAFYLSTLALVGVLTYRAATSTVVAAPSRILPTPAVHAAFTLNLTQFVSWPESAFASPEAPLVIGTFPRDPVNDHLDPAARNEKVGERPVRTIRIQSLEDVLKCHVVYVPRSNPRQGAVLARAAGRPILTIGDAPGFLQLGGHVQFVPRPPHTRLKISVENLKSSGLTGQSQLLRLAAR